MSVRFSSLRTYVVCEETIMKSFCQENITREEGIKRPQPQARQHGQSSLDNMRRVLSYFDFHETPGSARQLTRYQAAPLYHQGVPDMEIPLHRIIAAPTSAWTSWTKYPRQHGSPNVRVLDQLSRAKPLEVQGPWRC